MAIPENPLPKPHLDKLLGLSDAGTKAGEDELERREQELWNAWLKFYFTGEPVEVCDGAGGRQEKTFAACDLVFDQGSTPDNAPRPVIHVVLADRRTLRRDRQGGGVKVIQRWTRNFLVRVPSQAAPGSLGDAAAGLDAGRECRRVAEQLRWLLDGPEVQSLALKGVGNLEIANGPRMIASGSWHTRQIVTTEDVRYTVIGNEP